MVVKTVFHAGEPPPFVQGAALARDLELWSENQLSASQKAGLPEQDKPA